MKKVFGILALVAVMSAGLVSCESDSSEASLYENVKGTDGDEIPRDKRSTDGDEIPLDKRSTDGDEIPLDKRSTDGDEIPLDKRSN